MPQDISSKGSGLGKGLVSLGIDHNVCDLFQVVTNVALKGNFNPLGTLDSVLVFKRY